ncbi:MAG: response regulator transcription factor [Rhodocyclaceae bacterium]|jgi:DNA-binding NarL/FixJ family response regulator|nr:response regulator transcription factor [Rhodocyclaceae bacterium]
MIRILIADDHAILRAGLRHLLSEYPDIVVADEASNGAEALAKARTGHWDVMVLDMSMPGKSGIELIKQLKQLAPKLPLLILSMHKEDVYAVRALKAGAAGYLCKDNAEDQLVPALRKVAAGGLYITAAVAEKLALGVLHGDKSDVLPHTRLSDREYQIFQSIVAGESVTDIARKLNLSVKTVSTHKTHILEKMGCASVAEIVRYAIRHELSPGGPE